MENILLQSLKRTYDECLKIAEAKNSDYASCENPFSNFELCQRFGVSVESGIIVRICDKISRITNLTNKDHVIAVSDESLYDTINDAINYLGILKSYIEQNGVNIEQKKRNMMDAMLESTRNLTMTNNVKKHKSDRVFIEKGKHKHPPEINCTDCGCKDLE